MCSNRKNYSSPEETEKVDNIDMVRKGNTDAEREGSGEDNSTDGRRNKKRSPWVQRAAKQRHRALLSSIYQWALWVLGLWELGEPSVSGSAHPSGKSCEADWIVFKLFWRSSEAIAYSLERSSTMAWPFPASFPNPTGTACAHVQEPGFFQVSRDPQTL